MVAGLANGRAASWDLPLPVLCCGRREATVSEENGGDADNILATKPEGFPVALIVLHAYDRCAFRHGRRDDCPAPWCRGPCLFSCRRAWGHVHHLGLLYHGARLGSRIPMREGLHKSRLVHGWLPLLHLGPRTPTCSCGFLQLQLSRHERSRVGRRHGH